MTTTKPLLHIPHTASDRGDHMPFRVWAVDENHQQTTGATRYLCMAAFRYLQECLDFIGYCHSRECDVWFQSPTGVDFKKAPVRAEPAKPAEDKDVPF